ncbi:MAG: exodeoxyribonuclease VII small subunit [Deltaproteobacteria bacterium]|nr:exodeoxyribonuclease VII small subunit [Deltaproteobacteria bacterium]
MKKNQSYSSVLKQLETIVEKMNKGEVPIDELGDQVKKSAGMIKFLRQRLRSVEVEITEVLKDLEDDQGRQDELPEKDDK